MFTRRTLLLAGFGCIVAAGGWITLTGRGVQEVAPRTELPRAALPDPQPADTDCPWWRGCDRNGIAAGVAPPADWGASQHIQWRTEIPGSGHASPCVWGDRVFLLTCDEPAEVQSLVCVDRGTGRQRWMSEVNRGGLMEKHARNSHASATPAADGTRIFAVCTARGAVWVTAVDFAGRRLWQTRAGDYWSQHGYGSSPVLYQSLVIVAGDNRGSRLDRLGDTSFLTALRRDTGEIAWRIKRENGDSFGTPIVGRIAGKAQLLLSGKRRVVSYDPESGRQLWSCDWPAARTAGTVAFDDQCVYATATHEESLLICIRADGSGDVSATHVVWKERKGAADVPSPLVYDGRLYVLGDQGVLTCLQAATGRLLGRLRLGGNFAASPVLAGGRVFAINDDGAVFVIGTGDRAQLLGESRVGGRVLATPALCGGQAFVRTADALLCIGSPPDRRIAAGPAPSTTD